MNFTDTFHTEVVKNLNDMKYIILAYILFQL